MDSLLKKSNNFKEIIQSNYKRKFLYLALSPIKQSNTKTRNNSLKPKDTSNLSLSPQISILKNSFLHSQMNQKMPKRNSTSTSISKIKLFNQYDNMDNIIYNKKFIQKDTYNILVAVRIRPLNKKEELISTEETISVENKNTILLKDPNGYINPNNIRAKEQFLTFDYVFDKNETQENIFNNTTKFLITGVVNGYNATVFAYGATGAGKTYTMLGDDGNPGIMPYTLKELFNEIKLYPDKEFKVKLWYLEIYNENIRDLLVNNSENLELREDPIKGLIVNGITEKETNSSEDILSLLKRGNKNRTTEETDANETSSRSHAILQILVSSKDKENINNINTLNNNKDSNNNSTIKFGKLSLIDLAGSERASISGSKGMRLIEGGNINKSLLVLGNCINALCEINIKGNKPHIPYRDSKLTRLLKDSLGGNSRTVMIANVSPFIYNFDDTYNTLKYAERAKHIKTKINKNIINYNTQYLRNNYLNVIRKLHFKINDLENKLLFYENNNKYLKSTDLSKTPKVTLKKTEELDDIEENNNFNEKDKNLNSSYEQPELNKEKENEIGYNIDTIKENNTEFENSDINNYMEKNEKIIYLIEEFTQQTQAEVKLKQKIMGIHYDIHILNKIINDKEIKKQNITEEKTKLKSFKKILEKNLICFNEISQKNESTLIKYTDNNKNVENKNNNILIENNESKEEDKIELNDMQKRFIYMIRKISKIQMENIEIKYNYALIKDENSNKDKKIKDLEKQIQFRDIIIKEKIALDNNEIDNEELNKKNKVLLSEKQRLKFKTCTRQKDNNLKEKFNEVKIEKIIKKDNNIIKKDDIKNTINVQKSKTKNRRKQYSFHPRNSSFIKSNQIQTPNREKNLDNSLLTHTFLNNRGYKNDNNIINYNSSEIHLDNNYDKNRKLTIDIFSKEETNEIIGNEFDEIIKNFNLDSITSENFGDMTTIKKRGSGGLLKNNFKSSNKKENNKNIEKDNEDDDYCDDTNNKTLKSVLNDIKNMNSDINSKLNIIEKASKNQSNSQIKPISRTMATIENINQFINESNQNNKNKNKSIKSTKKTDNNNLKVKKSENMIQKGKIKKENLKTSCNSSSNLNLITANTFNLIEPETTNKKEKINNLINDTKNNNPSFIISVNRNKKNKNNKKFTLISSMSSNIQLNTISTNKDINNLPTKSPLCRAKMVIHKGYDSSSIKTINFNKTRQKNISKRNKSLLTNNIDKDELRKNIKEFISNKKNKYKIKKKYMKSEGKESSYNSNHNSLDKIKDSNEITKNINIDNIMNSKIQNKEKTKLQLFYSEHLNKHKNNSPKNLTEKKISNIDITTKNSKSIINNDNDSSLVDMGTNHDTIDNRKKKSFICPKNKDKKEGNKYAIKNFTNREKKKK